NDTVVAVERGFDRRELDDARTGRRTDFDQVAAALVRPHCPTERRRQGTGHHREDREPGIEASAKAQHRKAMDPEELDDDPDCTRAPSSVIDPGQLAGAAGRRSRTVHGFSPATPWRYGTCAATARHRGCPSPATAAPTTSAGCARCARDAAS